MPWKRSPDRAVLKILLRLLVIAGLVYAGVHLWYGVVEKRLQPTTPPARKESVPAPQPPAPPQAAVPPSAANDVQTILTRNIFKAVQHADELAPTPAEEETDLDSMAQTQLRLTLLGTVTGKDEDGRAIIRDEHSKLEDLYRVGSEIQGAIISRIARGKVVLRVNNREEILVLTDPESAGNSPGGAAGRPMARMEPGRPINAQEPPGVEDNQPVPEAVPRRRISFRGDGVKPTPSAAVKSSRQEVAPAEQAQEAAEVPVEQEMPAASTDAPIEAAESSVPVESGDVGGGEASQ